MFGTGTICTVELVEDTDAAMEKHQSDLDFGWMKDVRGRASTIGARASTIGATEGQGLLHSNL